MADPCIIKSGEKVDVNDPRLNDTGCTIEQGVIISTPSDLSVAVPPTPKAVAVPSSTRPRLLMEIKEQVTTSDTEIEEPKVAPVAVVSQIKETAPQAVVVQPDPVTKEVEAPMDPATVATLAVGAVAAMGTAAATSAMGGVTAFQAKVASVFGTSKATVATAAVVTAGTIVSVKAMESKMKKLETDLDKTKKEVGDTASSIDRIDALLDRLGS
jgi:hypothetical protein